MAINHWLAETRPLEPQAQNHLLADRPIKWPQCPHTLRTSYSHTHLQNLPKPLSESPTKTLTPSLSFRDFLRLPLSRAVPEASFFSLVLSTCIGFRDAPSPLSCAPAVVAHVTGTPSLRSPPPPPLRSSTPYALPFSIYTTFGFD